MISPRSILAMAVLNFLWIFITLMLLFVTGLASTVDVRDMSIDEYVNYVNPPAVHKFLNEHGDSILCVKHSDQISLNPHRNHGHSNNLSEQRWMDSKSTNSEQNMKKVCPDGTMPIREIKRESVESAGSVARFISKRRRNTGGIMASESPGHIFSVVQLHPDGGDVVGASGSFNVWQPYVDTVGQSFSISEIWVINEIGGPEETVEAGWIVYPEKFGDNQARLFTYWTNDGYKRSGCYNQDCAGFVLADGTQISPGLVLQASVYHGAQVEYSIKIQRENKSEGAVWTLYVQNQEVGHWPCSLFSRLSNTATRVDVGGSVYTTEYAVGTPVTYTAMGSGHFQSEGYSGAAFVRQISVFGSQGPIDDPPNRLIDDKVYCYDIRYSINKHDVTWGQHIFYGGPGGNNPACVN